MDRLRAGQRWASSVTARGHFADIAQGWISRYETRKSFQARLAIVSSVIDRYVGSGARVLDYGAGAGIFSLVASERASWVLALDLSEAMQAAAAASLEQAIKLIRRSGRMSRPPRIHRVVGDIHCLNEEHCRFDVILAIAVLEYLEYPAAAFATLCRMVAPGGVIIFSIPQPNSLFRRVEVPINRLAAAVGRLTGSKRLYDRRYSELCPQRGSQRLDLTFGPTQLLEAVPLPLGLHGWRRHVKPSILMTVRPDDR